MLWITRISLQRGLAIVQQAQRPLLYRGIRTAPTMPARLFVDAENQYAHSILSGSLKPYQIARIGDLFNNAAASCEGAPQHVLAPNEHRTKPADLYEDLLALVQFCSQTQTQISDERFADFVRIFCEEMHRLSDEQLVGSLRSLQQLPTPESTKTANYMELWNTLDIECCRRIERWSSAQLLLVSDAWYQLGLVRIGEFVWLALRKLGRKVRKLPPEQLVQSMFLCNLLRRPVFEMFDFEHNLAHCVQQMTLPELGVMAMGFFKTQTPIRNPELLQQLFDRLEAQLDTVEDITLVALLKILRYSSKLQQVDAVNHLLNALQPQVERVSLLTCLHMALLGCELQTCNDELVERILLRFEHSLDEARLKDLERICLVIALFNLRTPSGVEHRLVQRVPQLLRSRIDEILRYPRCYTNCLQFLSMRQVCDIELLTVALEPRFVRHVYRSGMPGREYFHLDSLAQLLGAEYTGAFLTEKQRQQMGKLYTQYVPDGNFKLNKTDRVMLEIRDALGSLLRTHVHAKHLLPHFDRCDLVVCYDRQQQRVLPLSTDCPADYTGVLLTRQHLLGEREAPHVETLVVVVAGWNNVIRDKERLTGQFAMKLQQLRQMRHKPIVIYWHEWRELETSADRQDFLKRRLRQAANI
ncbi:FAST kinase domain-containing protein 5, mitochondrial [Drosophila sulfurigaster albostrigata]|uniref:FAST kinase domain-containing protein 5, mitochondrial n=1 Tax=Drosophila sulfurigaster albostrigata TaxID=89887 RepID=UPI002D21C598|nr:FAST kinase domain-containing protein 5, mitochondrial [Drosophila sulfurigaster albostrigata]